MIRIINYESGKKKYFLLNTNTHIILLHCQMLSILCITYITYFLFQDQVLSGMCSCTYIFQNKHSFIQQALYIHYQEFRNHQQNIYFVQVIIMHNYRYASLKYHTFKYLWNLRRSNVTIKDVSHELFRVDFIQVLCLI